MDLSKEFIEEHKLEEAQVKAVTELTAGHIADLKGEWDGLADKNTNGILEGVILHTSKSTGFKLSRDQGEKHGDYLKRFNEAYLLESRTKLDGQRLEYEEKIKNVKGSETLSKEFETLQLKHSELQKKEATFDELNSSGIKDKYDTLIKETNSLKIGNAFNSVKPSFPDTVNAYEVLAKWDTFKKEILNSNTLESVDGEWIAVDKENKHKTTKLTDLVSKDADLTKLMEGRQQTGTKTKEVNLKDIEGVPFQVPENANSIERSKLIKDHLLSKGINPTHPDFTGKFAELNSKILKPAEAA